MIGSKKEHRLHQQRKNVQSTIGLEPQSLTDVTSYPYPNTIRGQDRPQDGLREHSDAEQSKQQVENWEDEGGTV